MLVYCVLRAAVGIFQQPTQAQPTEALPAESSAS